ncbi:TPA: hypothetical protein ACH3X1_001933 [Trebouxia sp. C0004]
MEQVRSMFGVAPHQEVTWVWKQSGYSPWVRLLAAVYGADIGLLGQGMNGKALCCEDCTLCHLAREREGALSLKAAANSPHLVQCLGVFDTRRVNGRKALVIATECVPGLNLSQAWEVLKSELAGEPDSGDKIFEAAKFVGRHLGPAVTSPPEANSLQCEA